MVGGRKRMGGREGKNGIYIDGGSFMTETVKLEPVELQQRLIVHNVYEI